MRDQAVFEFLSEELHTKVRILNRTSLAVECCFESVIAAGLHDDFILAPENASLLSGDLSFPVIFSVNSAVTYLEAGIGDRILLAGPVGVIAECTHARQVPALLLPHELIPALPVADKDLLVLSGVMLHNLYAEQQTDASSLYARNFPKPESFDVPPLARAAKSMFDHEEYGAEHNPYEAEVREMESIEKGDLQGLRENWREDELYKTHLGRLSEDLLRSSKYLCVINIALSSRAAIRGGVPYEMAFSLSDAYCQMIDSLDERQMAADAETSVRNIQLTFTKLVAEQKGDISGKAEDPPLVQRARDYIFANLHSRLTVQDVAAALKTHPNYLSRLFRESQGITVHDYILRAKTDQARNMLTYSDYSYAEIATYLGFSSQSHMGTVFRKFTGMTPGQYRSRYHKFS